MYVRYARDMWQTNGLCIRIRLAFLSNFHVQSILIRATVYFKLIFKVLKQYSEIIINSKLSSLNARCTQFCVHGSVPEADMWVQGVPVDQSKFDWSTGGGAPLSYTVLLT